jgi:hypothetical protein
MMDRVKRNAEIVALVKARMMPMREIAARYRLSTSSISLIAIRHGVHAQAADPKKVQAASKLIQRGMPLRHVAQTVGLDYQRLRHLLEKQGVYKVPPPNRPWSAREVRVLRRDYGKPGRSLRTIAAKIGRTCQAVNLKAALLGLSWPLEFRASTKAMGATVAFNQRRVTRPRYGSEKRSARERQQKIKLEHGRRPTRFVADIEADPVLARGERSGLAPVAASAPTVEKDSRRGYGSERRACFRKPAAPEIAKLEGKRREQRGAPIDDDVEKGGSGSLRRPH